MREIPAELERTKKASERALVHAREIEETAKAVDEATELISGFVMEGSG